MPSTSPSESQVAEGGRPARRLPPHGVVRLPGDLGEPAAAIVPEDLVGLTVARREIGLVDAGVDVAVGDEDVEVSVVVEVDHARTPPQREPRRAVQIGLPHRVGEQARPVVDIGVVGLVGEVRHEEIERAVAIQIPHVPRPCPPGDSPPWTAPRRRERPTPRNAPRRRSGRGSSAPSRWRRRGPDRRRRRSLRPRRRARRLRSDREARPPRSRRRRFRRRGSRSRRRADPSNPSGRT